MTESFENADLGGAVFRNVDLTGARFVSTALHRVTMRGVELVDVSIDGLHDRAGRGSWLAAVREHRGARVPAGRTQRGVVSPAVRRAGTWPC